MTPRTGRGAGAPRGPYRKSRDVRQRILDAALEVFAQCGYRSGSLREIATRVDMSEAGLLHHFPSKITLLEAVLEHRDERANRIVDHEAEDGMETLRGMLELALSTPRNRASSSSTACWPPRRRRGTTRPTTSSSPGTPGSARRSGGRWSGRGPPDSCARGRPGTRCGAHDRRRGRVQVQWLLDRDSLDMAEELADYLRHFLTVPVEP